ERRAGEVARPRLQCRGQRHRDRDARARARRPRARLTRHPPERHMFQTEFEFTLPCGYLDEDGTLHREGVMRRATAADEILPLRDPRVQRNDAYVVVILLSRVVTRLGSLPAINPKVIEGLFATDLAFLQQLYNRVNQLHDEGVVCPHCGKAIAATDIATREPRPLGEWSGIPSIN